MRDAEVVTTENGSSTGESPVPASDDPSLFAPKPGRQYFAMAEEPVEAEGRVRLDVIDASDERLSGASLRKTSGDARRLWPESFRSTESASALRNFLESFDGGMVAATVTRDAALESPIEEGRWSVVEFTVDAEIASASAADDTTSSALDRIFGSALIRTSPAQQIATVLDRIGQCAAFVTWDVGQGAGNAILNDEGIAVAYSDVGAGSHRNVKTRPRPWADICLCANPLIVLSHWDTDHWAAANLQIRLLSCTWLAPRQRMGPTHTRLVARILESGGTVHFVKRSSRPLVASIQHAQQIALQHGTGGRPGRNDSGLILTVHNSRSKATWMFPGDADYSAIPVLPPLLVGLVASHHGAAPYPQTVSPSPKSARYRRLVYSFGENNSYKHPRATSRSSHRTAGWADADVRDTCQRALPPSRSAVAVGWTKAPRCLMHMSSRHGVTPIT